VSDEKTEISGTVRSSASAPSGSHEPGGTVTMAASGSDNVIPAGEDIHLPPGTPIPFVIAFAITMTLVGTTISWIWTIIGGIAFIIALGMWIRDTRQEVAHLPDELGSPTHH
jgi:hypothetical protein